MRIDNLFFLLCFLFLSCNQDPKSFEKNASFLPNASGENNEMLIVMDSLKFKDKIGRILVDIYGSFVEGLPQPESKFDLHYIKPRNFNSILKHAKNIVVAFSLEGESLDSDILRKNFNKESINKIQSDTSIYYFKRKDQYAKGQNILYLFSRSDDELYNKIKKNRKVILKYFEDEVTNRVNKEIFSKLENNLSEKIFNEHGIILKIPFGYDLAINNPANELSRNFFWLRQLELDFEKNIFVYYEDYVWNQFKDFHYAFSEVPDIKFIRDKLSKQFLRDSENKEVFMSIQDVFPINSNNINFKGRSGVESKGLWKLSDISAGGPFHSLIFYDSEKERVYYIEGYVYAPGLKKRDLMQEIKSILWTFDL